MKASQLTDLGLVVLLFALMGRISLRTALLILLLTGEI